MNIQKDLMKVINFALNNYNPNSGLMNRPLPDTFIHRQGAYNCGYGEGLITGRGEKIRNVFGDYKSIHWSNGKAIVLK